MGNLWRGNLKEPLQNFWCSKTKGDFKKMVEFNIAPLRNQQVVSHWTNVEFTALKWSLYKIFIGHSHNIEFSTYVVFRDKA